MAGEANAQTTLQTELNCLHHQAALALKPGLLSIPNLCSAMVRMTRAMRATKFQSLFQEGLDKLAYAVERRVVANLPDSIAAMQERHQVLLDILGHDLQAEEKQLILSMFNSSWDDEVGQGHSCRWVHWCAGCCTSQQVCVERTQEALRLLFAKFPQVPLLYRWKGWGAVQNFCTRGVFIHNFLAFLIKGCCNKGLAGRADDLLGQDEDSPDMSYAVKQEVRMSKTVAFVCGESIRVAWFAITFT